MNQAAYNNDQVDNQVNNANKNVEITIQLPNWVIPKLETVTFIYTISGQSYDVPLCGKLEPVKHIISSEELYKLDLGGRLRVTSNGKEFQGFCVNNDYPKSNSKKVTFDLIRCGGITMVFHIVIVSQE